jgi:hypothetical protein
MLPSSTSLGDGHTAAPPASCSAHPRGDTSSTRHRDIINSAQVVRKGDPMGPLMFSLGIRSVLRGLASTLGPDGLILAYLDDIYILSSYELALEQTQAFFEEEQPLSASTRPGASRLPSRTSGQMASGCWEPAKVHAPPGSSSSRKRSTTRLLPSPSSSTCPTNFPCSSYGCVCSRTCGTCSGPSSQMT